MEIAVPSLLRIKPGALNKIGKYLRNKGYRKIGLFLSDGIRDIVEPAVTISLESSEIRIAHEVIVTDNQISDVMDSAFDIPGEAEALVAIGGGKAIDFCKYIAFISHLPLITVPTSLSNDGFCSPLSSLYVRGKRRSLRTRIPDGVIVDTLLASGAPERFLLSGSGDLISNVTAIQDWKEAFYEQGVAVNDFAVLVASQAVDTLLNLPNKDINNPEFVGVLAGGLVMSGVAMEICGSSRPSSGSDHLVSHAYDLTANDPSLHGIQVGIAALGIAILQQNRPDVLRDFAEAIGLADYVRSNPLEKAAFLEAIEKAPEMKKNFWSVLSVPENRRKLADLVENDAWYGPFFA